MKDFIEALPKTETHLHIEGAIPCELFAQEFPGQFTNVPEFRQPGFRYDNFAQFESILIDYALKSIKEPYDYAEIAGLVFLIILSKMFVMLSLAFMQE